MTLYSDRMLVYYAEQTGNVTKIDADGNVKLIKGPGCNVKDSSLFCGRR